MATISRRQLAKYAVEQIIAGQKSATLAKHLAAALLEANMAPEFDLLISDINQELEARGLLARAVVTSSTALSSQLKTALTKQIKSAAQVKEVAIAEKLDPSVIGGVLIETALHTWDKTVARTLTEIKGGI